MRIEIERKAWVRDVDGLRLALERKYGRPRETLKTDRYYVEPGAVLSENPLMAPKAARLRREGSFSIVTSKSRRIIDSTEVNRETEFLVDDPEAFEEFILGHLGFEVLVDKVKHTWAFKGDGLTVELSALKDLGWFFEVEHLAESESETETATRKIDEVFAEFGSYLGEVEAAQYIVLLLRKAGRMK